MNLYFIYGTLKKGKRNDHIMKQVKGEFICPVETVKPYPMFDLGNGFPFLQDSIHFGKIIQGELYLVDEKYDKKLDYFEGVPSLYKRGTITVEFEDNVYDDINCYFITDELTNGELEQVDFINEWED